jgi:protein TonB
MKRWLISVPIAIAISIALFAFMATMITPASSVISKPDQAVGVEVMMSEPKEQETSRVRTLPPQPISYPPPPSVAMRPIPSNVEQSVQDDLINELAVGDQLESISVTPPTITPLTLNASDFNPLSSQTDATHQQAVPLYRQEPNYPQKALRNNIEGYVQLSFMIDEQGHPQEILVIDAVPAHLFEREAVRALRHWQYQPHLTDGKATVQPNQTVKIEFRITH